MRGLAHAFALTMVAALAPLRAVAADEPGLVVGARLGVGAPLGSVGPAPWRTTSSLSGYFGTATSLGLDLGYRVLPELTVGAYLELAKVATTLRVPANDAAYALNFGVRGELHPFTPRPVDPWLGVGFGYASLAVTPVSWLSGFELARLDGGVDIPVGDGVAVGPYAALAIGEYGVSGATDPVHEWLTFGLRGRARDDRGKLGSQRRPDDGATALELGVRTGVLLGYGAWAPVELISFGSADIHESFPVGAPLRVDVGLRVKPELFLGGFGQVALMSVTAYGCQTLRICTVEDVQVGFDAALHVLPRSRVDPWVALGFGYDLLAASVGPESPRGWQYLTAELGGDYKPARSWGFGPFATFSVGEFGTSGTPSATHEWLTFGVRGVADVGL